jgi:ribosomal protein S18 acetylase RimI-like enzyme
MTLPDPIDRPAVLRCGRCGRIADWTDARVQIVCGCRSRLELPPPLVREAVPADRDRALDIFLREFGGRQLVADGQPVSLEHADLLVAETEGGVTGALAWRRVDDALHVMALATDPMWQRSGVGGYLVAEAELLAKRQSLSRVRVTVSNDNIPALYFYQRRGYRLSAVLIDSLSSQPANRGLVGFANIPIVDEVQLSKPLT